MRAGKDSRDRAHEKGFSCERILVRAPEWIETGSDRMTCRVEGRKRTLGWEGRYVDAGSGTKGQTIRVEFPITMRRVEADIGRQRFALTVKGNTVMKVDPPGKRIPLYQRENYLRSRAPMIRVHRFIPAMSGEN